MRHKVFFQWSLPLGALLFAVLLIIGADVSPAPALAQSPSITPVNLSFRDDLTSYDLARWIKADRWTNGDPFNCSWAAEHVIIADNLLTLLLDDEGCPLECENRDYKSGEYRSTDFYHYGTYQVRMKPTSAAGTVTSFFLYIDSWDGVPHEEIDIQFLGKDTTRMQINYHMNGNSDHVLLIDLGFDAASNFHTYGIKWTPDAIHWLVDGVQVHTEDGSQGILPSSPMRIMINFWPGTGVDDWLDPFVYNSPLESEYDWISYTVPAEIFLPQIMQ